MHASLLREFPDAEHTVTYVRDPESRPIVEVAPAEGVDLCIVPRLKRDSVHRNWNGWERVANHFTSKGLRVVALGSSDMTLEVCSMVTSTDKMAAAICGAKLTLSTDTGPAHLANLLSANLALVWGSTVGVIPGQSYAQGCHARFQRQSIRPIHHIEGGWEDVEKVITVVERLL
jgi:ADP-heptose:LPS heptosyltransferase